MPLPFDVYDPPRFATLRDAYRFARDYCGTCQREGERTRAPSWWRTARELLRLQAALDTGDWQIVCYPDDDVDTSFDETGETDRKLADGTWIACGVALQHRETWTCAKTGETEDRWDEGYDRATWGCIYAPGEPYPLVCAVDYAYLPADR